MPKSTEYHAEQLRLCASLGGQIEIHEPGSDEPTRWPAASLLGSHPHDHTARHALSQARQRTLMAAADIGADLERLGRYVADEVALLAAAHARTLANIEQRGGSVTYRVQR